MNLPALAIVVATDTISPAPACPATPTQVDTAVDTARAARGDAFPPARHHARQLLRCVSGPLSPEQAAAIHELEAMASLRHRDLGDVVDHFQAAALAVPGSTPGADYPDGHAMRDLATEARERAAPLREPIAVAAGHLTRVDGRVSTSRRADLPAVVQVVGPDGTMRWSDLVAADAVVPSFESDLLLSRRERVLRTSTLSATAAVAIWSGVAWTVSLSTRSQMKGIAETALPVGESPDAEQQLRDLQTRANRWGYIAQASTGVALGLTGATVVVWW